MSRAVLSIGSNLGDRLAHLRSVVEALTPQLVAVSPVYTTAPWGGVPQEDYLNAVVVVEDSELGPHDWLERGQRLEQRSGRVREIRWGARTLDVDVIWCAERGAAGLRPVTSADPELTLPHPQAHNRAFVLVPWAEVEPDATLEVDGRTRRIRDLLAELDPGEIDGVRLTDLSLSAAQR
ncbi:2-amino-4-hydroxy-6-hydroxymethyldihydropteridine diphosphokinase [Nocardia cerradoensis]|uniref:2-amino-4-hydroxy-6- hydroxymethyldihydropteridine diphosphokinase n=1 Tax=Nocardia cerradoensis TaxID=85688 RepID=UPI0002E808E0|nr:2-amino-4-hydroxy-6-hydroxymethyldihydropteridine diphosphokinase [Nocardia cerradoensis]NKY47576.1 2-amino-4-hydroxy-6-hydroxymethyldihydropteridine diphosphokinase [Nocardia cerradoensis]